MLVDWFTTAAQIVNFLILVWLLKRFLYKPILRAMDERERRMTKALEDTETEKKSAENERLAFEEKSQRLAEEEEGVLKSAAQQAEEERKRLLAAVREEVVGLEARWREAIERERDMFLEELSARIQNEVLAITRQVLSDLAGANLETCVTQRFTERLRSLDADEREGLALALRNCSNVIVTSAFELSENSRSHIEETVRHKLGVAAEMQFMTAPELIAGIELRANGRRIAWSIQDYLSSVQKELEDATRKQDSVHAW
jgi:F-type H+-transporting ATPase subunit b